MYCYNKHYLYQSPVKFTAPSIMSVETPKSFDGNDTKQPMFFKRPLNGGDEEDTPSKRSNLFIECLEHSRLVEEHDDAIL